MNEPIGSAKNSAADDPMWRWVLDGLQPAAPGARFRSYIATGLVRASSGPDALAWLMAQPPAWDALAAVEGFTVTVSQEPPPWPGDCPP
jgi:hypothetical protein